ncbi:MAG: carboxylesterase family protein [Rhizorhabdus sp.]|uniref:carboxylesterase family protein n=1 Tax=Rhizorhabdus sp. TaxID=1968843 RepID=UPI001B4B5947|nr:carboxylesterase family protein [Rhizorhabdus sp.]MBP8233227.1 carboxylesterase family protein [Rhizorhabdus sp.]
MAEVIAATQSGKVRGEAINGVRRFLGIPYAASPTGARRFAPPEPAPAWDGIRNATVPGPTAPHRLGDACNWRAQSTQPESEAPVVLLRREEVLLSRGEPRRGPKFRIAISAVCVHRDPTSHHLHRHFQ